jgi:two-component system osmolarity sensor histidine kinase EnvZ
MPQKSLYYRFNRFLEAHLPAGLYQRALIILVAPLVLLQTIMTGVILDRHWDSVTRVLARSLAREIGLLTALYDKSDKGPEALKGLEELSTKRLRLSLKITHDASLPPPVNSFFFSLVDKKLSRYLQDETGRPFWIDSVSKPGTILIRVEAEKGVVFRMRLDEGRAYAVNTDALIFWMVFSSVILAAIAIVFLRKQINPILDLAEAAQNFGTGRDPGHFRPRGATEVKLAGQAFLDMRERLARHVEQRTTMLAGVSHDLRTVLTRFKLELAFLGDGPMVKPLKEDVEEMQRMLEAYLAFARGDGGEQPEDAPLEPMILAATQTGRTEAASIEVSVEPGLSARVKPNAFRRLLVNLISNAGRYARHVSVNARKAGSTLTVTVDDDGPGIPPGQRADAFRPFVRLDNARNLDQSGTGLGLAIALDIARAHGGDVQLADSPLGGLRAVVHIPV